VQERLGYSTRCDAKRGRDPIQRRRPFALLLLRTVDGKLVGTDKTFDAIYNDALGKFLPNKVSELVGEAATGLFAKAKKYIPTSFPRRYHGIESVFEDGAGNLIVLEAKGGTGRLAEGQMSKTWLRERAEKLAFQSTDPNEIEWGHKLLNAMEKKKLYGGVVTAEIDYAKKMVKDPEIVLKPWEQIGKDAF
jgi:hypothetical protein